MGRITGCVVVPVAGDFRWVDDARLVRFAHRSRPQDRQAGGHGRGGEPPQEQQKPRHRARSARARSDGDPLHAQLIHRLWHHLQFH